MHERLLRREREGALEARAGALPVVFELVLDRAEQGVRDGVPAVERERVLQRLRSVLGGRPRFAEPAGCQVEPRATQPT